MFVNGVLYGLVAGAGIGFLLCVLFGAWRPRKYDPTLADCWDPDAWERQAGFAPLDYPAPPVRPEAR